MNDARAPASSPGQRPDDPFAVGLRGFGPPGILAVLVIVASSLVFSPLGAVLVLLWASGRATTGAQSARAQVKSKRSWAMLRR